MGLISPKALLSYSRVFTFISGQFFQTLPSRKPNLAHLQPRMKTLSYLWSVWPQTTDLQHPGTTLIISPNV